MRKKKEKTDWKTKEKEYKERTSHLEEVADDWSGKYYDRGESLMRWQIFGTIASFVVIVLVINFVTTANNIDENLLAEVMCDQYNLTVKEVVSKGMTALDVGFFENEYLKIVCAPKPEEKVEELEDGYLLVIENGKGVGVTTKNNISHKEYWFKDVDRPKNCKVWSCGWTLRENTNITNACVCSQWKR